MSYTGRTRSSIEIKSPLPHPLPIRGESFASTGSQLGLDSLTVDSQVVERAPSVTSIDFQTAEGSQGDEDEEEGAEPSLLPPAKRSGRPRRQRDSSRKRLNGDDSEDLESTPSSSQETSPQTSSSAQRSEKKRKRQEEACSLKKPLVSQTSIMEEPAKCILNRQDNCPEPSLLLHLETLGRSPLPSMRVLGSSPIPSMRLPEASPLPSVIILVDTTVFDYVT